MIRWSHDHCLTIIMEAPIPGKMVFILKQGLMPSFQALSHVAPLRNYFLRDENYKDIKRPPGDQMFLLVTRFGELIRKLWNPRNFKAHVSPHEMLQAVVLCSKKKLQITDQGEQQMNIHDFAQTCSIASALATELPQTCTKLLLWSSFSHLCISFVNSNRLTFIG